jgi:hypothetical protein
MNNGADEYTASATTEEAGQMATFSPDDIATMPSGCDDATCLGAVTFTSDVAMAGVYIENNTGESPGQILLSTRGFTPGDFSTTVQIPGVKSVWKGRTTGIQIMNAGDAAADITLTLSYLDGSATGADGASVTFPSVGVGASVTYFPGNHTADDTLLGPFGGGGPDEFVGAATITSAEEMVAIVNENDFAAATQTKQTVYAGFAGDSGTETVLFPLVKEFYNGNQTGLQIMNIGDAEVTLTADYVFDTGTFTVDEDATGAAIVVPAGGAFTFWGVTVDWAWTDSYVGYTGGFGAVTVSATAGGEIVGLAQEAEFPAGGLGYLDTKNYEGFNQ